MLYVAILIAALAADPATPADAPKKQKSIGMSLLAVSDLEAELGENGVTPDEIVAYYKASVAARNKFGLPGLPTDPSWSRAKAPTKGMIVVEVEEGGVADKAGLAKGDIITTIDGKLIDTAEAFREWSKSTDIGREHEIAFYKRGPREYRRRTATLTIGELAADALAEPPSFEKLSFENLSDAELDEANEDLLAFVLKQVLAEAERRKAEPEVKDYLKASHAAWWREYQESFDDLKSIQDDSLRTRDPLLWNKIAERRLSRHKSLNEARYYAEVTDEEASFGQFLAEGEVIQVVDGSNVIAEVTGWPDAGESQTVWLANVDTGGFIDGSTLDITFFAPKLWSLDKASYTNALGAKRTVLRFTQHQLSLTNVTPHSDLFEFGPHRSAIHAQLEKREKGQKQAAAADNEQETRAARALGAIQKIIDRGDKAAAKGHLEKLVERYPGTEAAGKAEKLLEGL